MRTKLTARTTHDDAPETKPVLKLVSSNFRGNDLAAIADERYSKKAKITKLEAEVKKLDAILIPAAIKHGGGFMTDNDYQVTRVAFDRESINKDLLRKMLLAEGLTVKQITRIISGSSKKSAVEYVRVTDKEGKE